MQLQPGTLVLRGKYRIERLLGEGASAEVYLVELTRGQGQRALKILRRDLPGVGSTKINDYRSRFEREYDLQQQLLGNPRIIQAYDADDEDGSPALVMEYAAGGSLQDELDALTRRGERATPARCAELLQDIALGLQAMHERGWVHRDVKPRNVLLERAGGRAKLGDLGVAQTDQTRTRTDGQAWEHPGTPPYCSPEHANGLAYLTPAADVYALGVIGYRMLTGQVLAPATSGQPPIVIDGSASEWLKALIQRMLAWDYRERPQNGGAVAEEVGRGQAIEREREAAREARARELQSQVEDSLRSGDFARADAAVDELLRLTPDHSEALRLERRVSLAIVEEKHRIAAEEARRKAAEEAKRASDEAARQQASLAAAREREARLKHEKEEAAAAEQKRKTEEAAHARREADERQRLANEANAANEARLRLDEQQRQWAAAQVQAAADQITIDAPPSSDSASSHNVAQEGTSLPAPALTTGARPGIAPRLALPVAGLVGICLCLSIVGVFGSVLSSGGLPTGYPLAPTLVPTSASATLVASANPPTMVATSSPVAARATSLVFSATPSQTVGTGYVVTPGQILVLPQISVQITGATPITGSPVLTRNLGLTDESSASGLGSATLGVTAFIPLTGSNSPILPSIALTSSNYPILPGNQITGSLFDGLMTCATLTDGKCAYHETIFARGIRRIYVSWNNPLPLGTAVRVEWLLNGKLRLEAGDQCVITEEGCNPYVTRLSLNFGYIPPIPAGIWMYRIYGGDQLLAVGYVVVR